VLFIDTAACLPVEGRYTALPPSRSTDGRDTCRCELIAYVLGALLGLGWIRRTNSQPTGAARLSVAHVVKVARFVGSGASCMTPRGRLTRAGRLRSVGSTRIDEGATRHEMLMIDIETGPSATSPKWIDKGVVGG